MNQPLPFLAVYQLDSKPSEKRTERWVLEARLLPYFGDMTISQLDVRGADGGRGADARRHRSTGSGGGPAGLAHGAIGAEYIHHYLTNTLGVVLGAVH